MVLCSTADVVSTWHLKDQGYKEGNPLYQNPNDATALATQVVLQGGLIWLLSREDTPPWLQRLTSGVFCASAARNFMLPLS